MLTTLLAGAAVAISFAAPPGPVLVETIRRGLRGGFRPALLVQLGSIIGDMVWCAAALFGLAQFVSQPWVRLLLGGAGVLVLFWLGLRGIREALAAQPLTRNPSSPPAVPPESLKRPAEEHTQAFRSGMAISLTNPWAIGYWVGIGGAMIAAGIVGASLAQTAAFVGGYAAGVSVYALVVAGCFRWLHRHLRPGGRAARIITGLCGLSLFGLGLLLGWQMLGSLAA
jgi:chemosensory pili system protein ChpE